MARIWECTLSDYITDALIAKGVQEIPRAARALDTLVPGWAKRVNTDKLDLKDPRYCILGQAFGSWRNPMVWLLGSGYQHGRLQLELFAGYTANFAVFAADYSEYREAWTAEVEQRIAFQN